MFIYVVAVATIINVMLFHKQNYKLLKKLWQADAQLTINHY